jgi:hypothetical protein
LKSTCSTATSRRTSPRAARRRGIPEPCARCRSMPLEHGRDQTGWRTSAGGRSSGPAPGFPQFPAARGLAHVDLPPPPRALPRTERPSRTELAALRCVRSTAVWLPPRLPKPRRLARRGRSTGVD